MSERERWAYEELQAGDIIQEGDEWWPKDGTGQWQAYHQGMFGLQVLEASVARRPHNITALQDERDEFQTALIESRLALKRKVAEVMEVCKERDEAHKERDLARSEVARLSAELWARKPAEDRVAALTDEVAQLRAERQEWIDRCNAESVRALRLSEQLSAAEVAVKSAQRARDELQRQVDDLRSDRSHLQGLVDDLLDEPTAKRVYKMLQDMLDQTEWVGQCLDSSTYEQMSCIQRTISVVAERVRDMVKEGTSADA